MQSTEEARVEHSGLYANREGPKRMVRTEIVLAVALVSFFAGFVGVVLILWNKRWSARSLHWGIGFGAGLLIGISLLEIIPTAIELATEKAMIFVLLGFVGFFLVEKFTLVHHFERAREGSPFHFSMATFVALCLHAVLDGVVIGLGLHFNEAFGLVVFLAILFHKLPLSVSVASVFLGHIKRSTAVLQMLIFTLATPVGLVAAVVFLEGLSQEVMGAVVGLSAGIFIYLGATDMLPEINHTGQTGEGPDRADKHPAGRWIAWEPTVWVLVGMIVSYFPHLLLEGMHPH
jgi:zinc transporter ZupT